MRKIFTIFSILFSLKAFAVEDGDACSNPKKLPPNFTCFNNEIYDCNNQNQGRMTYIDCASEKVDKLRLDWERQYKTLLNAYKKSAKYGQNFVRASTSLTQSPKAWEQFMNAGYDLEDSLLGSGNASAAIVFDCYNSHLKDRIERFSSLENDLQ